MATNTTTQKLVMDASGFTPPIDAIIARMKALSGSNAEVKVSFNELNEVTGKTTIGLTQIAGANQKLTATLKETVNGLELAKVKLAEVATQSDKTDKQIKVLGLTWGSIARLLAVTAIRHVFLDIASGIREATKAAAEFQAKLGQLQAFNPRVGNTQQLSQQFGRVADQFNQPIGQVATAATQGVQAGVIQSANDLGVLTEAMRLAQLTGASTEEAMRTLGGAMQAFHLPTSEAANTVNQLFRAAQHGLTPELGNSLSNVSVIASRLGVTFPEVLRSFEALRARGSSGSDALAQLNAQFTGLERRTPALDAELRRLGYTSIQAAIADRGWAGALDILKDKMDDTGESARRLLSSRRSTGGLTLGQELGGPNGFNDRNQNAEEAARAGRVIRENTTFQQEFNKVATAFATEIGPKILEAFKKFGNFSEPIIRIANELAKWAPALAESINGLIIWASWLGKIAELIGLINPKLAEAAAANRRLADARTGQEASFAEAQSRQRESVENNARAQERIVIQTYQPQVQAAQRAVDATGEATRNMREQSEGAAKAILHSLSTVLSEFESVIKKAESGIKDSMKRVSEFADKEAQDAFKHRLASAGQVQQLSQFSGKNAGTEAINASRLVNAENLASESQIDLVRARIARLTSESTELFRKGDADSVASARRKLEERRQLTDELFNIEQRRAQRTSGLRAQLTGRDQQYNTFNAEREAAQRANSADEAALEAQNQARQRRNAETVTQITNQERAGDTALQRRLQDFNRLTVTNSRGEIHPDLAGSNGRQVGEERLTTRIDNVAQALRDRVTESLNNINRAQSSGAITPQQAEQMRRALPTEANITQTIAAMEGLKQALLAQLDAERRFVEIKDLMKQQIDAIKENTRVLAQGRINTESANRTQNQGLTDAQQTINDFRGRLPTTGERIDSADRGHNLFGPLEAFNTAATRAQEAILRAQGPNRTQGDIDDALAAFRAAKDAFETLKREQGTNRRGEFTPNPLDQPSIRNANQVIANLQNASVRRLEAETLVVQQMDADQGRTIQRQLEEAERRRNQNQPAANGGVNGPQSNAGGGGFDNGFGMVLPSSMMEALMGATEGSTPAHSQQAIANAQSQQAAVQQVARQLGLTAGGGPSGIPIRPFNAPSQSSSSGGGDPYRYANGQDAGTANGTAARRAAEARIPSFLTTAQRQRQIDQIRDPNNLLTAPLGSGTPVNVNNIAQANAETAQRMIQQGQMTDPGQIADMERRFRLQPGSLSPAVPYRNLEADSSGTYRIPGRNELPTGTAPGIDDEGFAEGGLIGNSFAAMGPDNVRINARVGEFVMNPDSTARFYTQLVAMNRGDSPRGNGYAMGGTVSNSIGEMNIHVNGAENPQKTAREVYNHIRREQRRGNI